MEETKRSKLPGILLALDFKKAFDSLEWPVLFRTLKQYNFGPSFIQWINTLINNTSSCVINNGTTSAYFNLGRGVRQGDLISPYIFFYCNINFEY
jgi:mannosylglycoprotein endo-beta-mannosidase